MKDPNRIPIILELLSMYWEKNPNKDLFELLDGLLDIEDSGFGITYYDDNLLREVLYNKVTSKWTLR